VHKLSPPCSYQDVYEWIDKEAESKHPRQDGSNVMQSYYWG